jgi:hypothetical protein
MRPLTVKEWVQLTAAMQDRIDDLRADRRRAEAPWLMQDIEERLAAAASAYEWLQTVEVEP